MREQAPYKFIPSVAQGSHILAPRAADCRPYEVIMTIKSLFGDETPLPVRITNINITEV